MPVIIQKNWYTVEQCRKNPKTLYVFGDNLMGVGKGGQAVIRDEPNAVGIPTKREPDTTPSSYLSDRDCDDPHLIGRMEEALVRLDRHLAAGGTVIIPADGVGTGRAELPKRAPALYAYLTGRLHGLFYRYQERKTA